MGQILHHVKQKNIPDKTMWLCRVGQPGRLSFPEFVRVFGWRDPRNAMVYVNTRAEALARKI